MKKIILFLALALGVEVNAQVVNQLTAGNFTKYLGSEVNFNRNNLKDFDATISKLEQGTTSTTLSGIWIGDSWTINGTITQPLVSYLRYKYGDAGVGYYGSTSLNVGMTNSDGQSATRTTVGSWTSSTFIVSQNTYVRSVSISSDSSATVGDSIYYVGRFTDAKVHYMTKSSGGSFVVRIDGTSPATVSTSGSTSLAISSYTGNSDATHTISLKVASAGSGVLINGVELNRNTNGIRIHNLGCSGSTAREWVRQDSTSFNYGIQQLAPNIAFIMLGVNDCSQNFTPTDYIGYVTRIVNRVKGAMPRVSICLVSPSDVGLISTYPMSSYVAVLKTYALNNGYAFINNYDLIGNYTTANARGLYTNTSHVNATGGGVMVDNLMTYLCGEKNGDLFNVRYFGTGSGNPSDATNYYFSEIPLSWSTTQGFSKLYFPYNATCIGYCANFYVGGTQASAETATLALNVDNTAYNLTTSLNMTTTVNTFTGNTSNVNVNAGSYVEAKIITPTWVTNPTTVYASITFWFIRKKTK